MNYEVTELDRRHAWHGHFAYMIEFKTETGIQSAHQKEWQIKTCEFQQGFRVEQAQNALLALQEAAVQNRNMFEVLMETAKVCTLGQITQALFEVGGQYRRNM
jgi:methylmalonyl-CoA mutase N-terminal domain/subunit